MFNNALEWLKKSWWGIALCYFVLIAFFYALLWAIIEPLGIPDTFAKLPSFFHYRAFYHVVLAVTLASHTALVLDLFARKREWARRTFRKTFTPAEAREFYDVISSAYDQRNSSEILATHRQVIRLIESYCTNPPSLTVLDLGGGTGKEVAHHFFNRAEMTWHYVDYSPLMLEMFQRNMGGTSLQFVTHLQDIHAFLTTQASHQYDVVVLSLVLTSLTSDPDWRKIAERLKPGGLLILADIDPLYTATHPYYAVSIAQDVYALQPRALSIAETYSKVQAVGLAQQSTLTIREGGSPYSFVAAFARKQVI